jgi:nifR3 family TIM-barrel protein
MAGEPSLTDSWMLGSLRVPNRVMLAPLAGIGNWFVRLQAKRYGAGMTVSEMLSSHAIHYGNERTCTEMMRIDPRERAAGPVSMQLFGEDPAMMRSAAVHVARAGADAIDINMGCPVTKVKKTGAGAALLDDPDRAVAVARAAVDGAREAAEGDPAGAIDGGIPVTVKLRSGVRQGETSGFDLAHRLVAEAGVAAVAFHPRSAAVQHKGVPDYELVARLVRTLPVPVILTGGLNDADEVRRAFRLTGAHAVMLARGALGNPWLFAELVRGRRRDPSREEVLTELDWLIDRAVEHLVQDRATRYLRKFYPWYVGRLGLERPAARRMAESLQTAPSLDAARMLLHATPRDVEPAV